MFKDRVIIISLFIFICTVLIALTITPSITQSQLKKFTNHTKYKDLIEVPDLLGKTISESSTILEDINLKVVQMPVSPYNPNFPKGSVIRQDPFAGDFVKNGRTIYLTPNPQYVTQIVIPDYSDKSFRSVRALFGNAKLQLGKIFYCNNYAENVVLRLDYNQRRINSGDTVPVFSLIDVYIGAGKQNVNEKTIKTPDLIGNKFFDYETGQKIQDVIKDNFLNVGTLYLDELDVKDSTDFFVYKQFPNPDLDTTFMFINEGGMSPELNLYFTKDSTKLITYTDSINNINND